MHTVSVRAHAVGYVLFALFQTSSSLVKRIGDSSRCVGIHCTQVIARLDVGFEIYTKPVVSYTKRMAVISDYVDLEFGLAFVVAYCRQNISVVVLVVGHLF